MVLLAATQFASAFLLASLGAYVGRPAEDPWLAWLARMATLAFIWLCWIGGRLADTHDERKLILAGKGFETLAAGLSTVALFYGRPGLLPVVALCLALEWSLFLPAVSSIVPELVAERQLSRANGLLAASGFAGAAAGLWMGARAEAWILVSAAGTLASLRIPPPANRPDSTRPQGWSKPFWLASLAIAYFWLVAAATARSGGGAAVALMAAGAAVGSLAAGRLSGQKVEQGLVPLGALGLTACLLAGAPAAVLGFFGGLYLLPLNAFLQQKSEPGAVGRVAAVAGVESAVGLLLGWWLPLGPLALGVLTLLVTVYILTILPDYLIRFALWMLTHSIYSIRVAGQQHVPFRGPALLVSNHISLVDGFLIGACVQRFIRFLVYRPYYELPVLHWFFRLTYAIPIVGGNPKDVAESIERARQELRAGHLVCIFAEGSISRTGNLLSFKRGLERILDGLEVPVIPVHLGRLWGSIFSFQDGRFFWKWPQRIPYLVTVSFGSPLAATAKAHEVRQVVLELASEAIHHARRRGDVLHARFLKTAKRRWFSFCMADSTGRELTYGRTLIGSLLLARWVRRKCGQQETVGLLLPASVAGALANIAVLLAGKVPVNLNFTAGAEAMASAVRQCGIRTILTAPAFLARAKLDQAEGMVFLEDVMREIGPLEKAWTAAAAFLLPSALLGPRRGSPDSLATVIFSSGSTGEPKGVMLSHHNILSNIDALAQIFWVTRRDRIMGVLPLFHSFGFTATVWFPVVAGFSVVYHPNPTDAKTIGEMVAKYKATILISTPTFYAGYLRKCSAEQFRSLRFAMVGAEKLQEPLAAAFREKYGLELLEGYGATEMAPVVSVNIPDVGRQKGVKSGTVGHPIPCVAAKVVDPESGEPLPPGREGLLLVKGPNRMLGYLGQPEKTREALRDGWYVTGDIASIDDDGFIRITDRLARFSKIGGEMVPHMRIEEMIHAILGEQAAVVTSVPDEQKGERLVVLHIVKDARAAELWERLSRTDLPKLWIPKREDFHYIEALPVLGTGKLDLRRAKAMAREVSR